MVISSIALFALVTVNSEFRKVFTQGEFILRRNRQLTASNLQLGAKNRLLGEQSKRLGIGCRSTGAVRQVLKARDDALAVVRKLEADMRCASGN